MKRSFLVGSIAAMALAIVFFSLSPATAAGTNKVEKSQPAAVNAEALSALHLMDRGIQATAKAGGNRAQNTLNPPVANQGIIPTTSLWFGSGTGLAGGFMGNCFDAVQIPSAWYPSFRITGAWAYQGVTTPYQAIVPTLNNVAAGVWPVAVPGTGTWTTGWAAHSIATAPFATGLVGGTGLFGTAATGGLPVTALNEVCGGLLVLQGWANLIGLAGGGGGSLYATWTAAPIFSASNLRPDSTWLAGFGYDVMAGLYVAGATVPVELQALKVE